MGIGRKQSELEGDHLLLSSTEFLSGTVPQLISVMSRRVVHGAT
jgi:hypothetical protein